ncbi:unnamed protein product [Dracunculus medinensis]|uniref:Fucosyltransferase n=1 Tax=Dracunculus medinensis TaxID=318479 RepID=A0A0N4UDS9_DRAME|nr:unnamed protein product [Dracunculus medinensis]
MYQRNLQASLNEMSLPKRIYSNVDVINNRNLNACPNWNCKIENGQKSNQRLREYDAIVMHPSEGFNIEYDYKPPPEQYFAFFSQESPVNTGKLLEPRTFNFSLNFRRDSPVSSPYGYAVKLAPKSRKFGTVIDERIISGKSHPITWFVSNSKTESRRELLVDELKKHIKIDIYGTHGSLICPRNSECEDLLDTK